MSRRIAFIKKGMSLAFIAYSHREQMVGQTCQPRASSSWYTWRNRVSSLLQLHVSQIDIQGGRVSFCEVMLDKQTWHPHWTCLSTFHVRLWLAVRLLPSWLFLFVLEKDFVLQSFRRLNILNWTSLDWKCIFRYRSLPELRFNRRRKRGNKKASQ